MLVRVRDECSPRDTGKNAQNWQKKGLEQDYPRTSISETVGTSKFDRVAKTTRRDDPNADVNNETAYRQPLNTAQRPVKIEHHCGNDSEDTFKAKPEKIGAIQPHPEPTIPQAKNRIRSDTYNACQQDQCSFRESEA